MGIRASRLIPFGSWIIKLTDSTLASAKIKQREHQHSYESTAQPIKFYHDLTWSRDVNRLSMPLWGTSPVFRSCDRYLSIPIPSAPIPRSPDGLSVIIRPSRPRSRSIFFTHFLLFSFLPFFLPQLIYYFFG